MSPEPGQTPSQTLGPYFSIRLGGDGQNVIAGPAVEGERIIVTGRVLDGERHHIEDALLVIWQADAAGRYNHPDHRTKAGGDPALTGFARATSDFDTGAYRFATVKPGPVPDLECVASAPHLAHRPGPRDAQPGVHAHLFLRRGRGQPG